MVDFAQDRSTVTAGHQGADQAARLTRLAPTVLYEFTDRLFRATTRHAVYDAALDSIIRGLGCSRASILLFDRAGTMRFVAWRGLSQDYRDAVSGHSPWRPGERDAQPICIENGAEADLPPELKAVLERERIQGLAFIPLIVDGALIGKFMTYYATPHRFAPEEIELAVTIARQLGFRIERLQSDEARGAAERALKSERELLHTIIDSAPVMITLHHVETGRLQLNRQFTRLLGWTPQPVTARALMELCFPDPEYRAKAQSFINACGPDWMDLTMRTCTGAAIETSWVNFMLTDGTRVGIGIEITDRKRAEEQQALLLGEMSHRLRNLFSVAGSVIDMSARNAQSPSEMAEAVHDRLHALTRAHALARPGTEVTAEPGEPETTLHALLTAIFAPYQMDDAEPPFQWSGPDVPLGLDALSGLALLLHEFATNAAKHGALSRPGGSVAVASTIAGAEFALVWREAGGPAIEGVPGARGFGAYLADRVVKAQFEGRMTREWDAAGLTIRLWLPLDRLMPRAEPPLVQEGPRK